MALEPITRKEQIIAGKDLQPITRMEKFLKQYGGSGGSSFRVRFIPDHESGSFTADKTCQQVIEAFNAGAIVTGVVDFLDGFVIPHNLAEIQGTADAGSVYFISVDAYGVSQIGLHSNAPVTCERKDFN